MTVRKNFRYMTVLLALFCTFEAAQVFLASPSYADPLIINKPTTLTNNSCFGIRWSRAHKGADYAGAIGTVLGNPPTGYQEPPVYVSNSVSAGKLVVFTYPGNTVVRYLHLDSYTPGPPPIMKLGSTGHSTGPHLHYEIILDGQAVDPEEAYGIDLNDPTIRECLKQDARQRLSGAIEKCQERRNCANGLPVSTADPPTVPPPETEPLPDEESAPTRPAGPNNVLYDENEYSLYGLTTNACDTRVFTTMRGKAAFEAQEDLVAAQIVVHRPDSVLEYSCADQFMGYTATKAGPLFSEASNWYGRSVSYSISGSTSLTVRLDAYSLDQALEDTVISLIDDYVAQQFPKKFLSDTDTLDYNPSSSIGGATYTCDKMAQVWSRAKCENFGDTKFFAAGGPFYQFSEMTSGASSDPRTQYNSCGHSGLVSYDLDVAKNKDFAYHGFSQATLAGTTNIHSYTDPSVCTGLAPIATGIDIVVTENFTEATEIITEYAEHFCANPGCYYDHTSGECKK